MGGTLHSLSLKQGMLGSSRKFRKPTLSKTSCCLGTGVIGALQEEMKLLGLFLSKRAKKEGSK